MSLPHWEYFRSIEADLEASSRYVEFASTNFNTFSVEFARIIMAAGSEIDTVAKEFCNKINPTGKPKNINEYQPIVIGKYPRLLTFEMEVPRYHLQFTPWQNWTANRSPGWWSDGFNAIKHDRTNQFAHANLENALLATSGLLVLLLYYYDTLYGAQVNFSAFEMPRLFDERASPSPSGWTRDCIHWDYHLLK